MALAAHAQDRSPAGLVASFNFEQRLEYSDNPDLDIEGDPDFFGRTVLGFGLRSDRALDNFALSFGTDLELGRQNRDSANFTNSFIGVTYDRATLSADIGFYLRYRESDTRSSIQDDEFLQDGNVINQTDGTRQSYSTGLSGSVGNDAPIGASYALDYRETRFDDTTDQNLTDSTFFGFSGSLDFQLHPRIRAQLIGKYEDFDARGNGVNRETVGIGPGVQMDITNTLRGDFALTYDRIERTGGQIGTDDGLSFNGRLTQDVTNGNWFAYLNSDVTTNFDGRRNFFGFGREMELPRGNLSYTLGGTNSETSDFEPLINLDYLHLARSSQFTVGLSQDVFTDTNNREQINTRLRAGYVYEITSLSRIGFDASFFNRNELGPFADDGQRLDLSLFYQHALTRDWGLVGGVSHIRSTRDSENADRISNTIYVGIQRNFTWFP